MIQGANKAAPAATTAAVSSTTTSATGITSKSDLVKAKPTNNSTISINSSEKNQTKRSTIKQPSQQPAQFKPQSQQPFFRITYINGIYHSVEDWKRIAEYIQTIFQCEVKPFYNPSSGWWMKDATKAGFELVLRPSDLHLSKDLATHLRSVLHSLHPQGRILHIAHSGGAILTYLAAKHHLTDSEVSRIDVTTFGGGKSLTHKYFRGSRVCNYYARNDPLVLVDKRANALLKNAGNLTYAEVKDVKHNTTFIFLDALANNPLVDHSMEGPTYRMALSLEAAAMRQRMKDFMVLSAKESDMMRRFRKAMANITGLHHFWDRTVYENVNIVTRKIRKSSAKMTKWHGAFSGKSSWTSQGRSNRRGKLLDEEDVMQIITDRSKIANNGTASAVDATVSPKTAASASDAAEVTKAQIDELLFSSSC